MIFGKFGVKVKALMGGQTANYLDFFKTVGKSKRILRSGFVREKVISPESVAEHSFRTGVIAMVLSDKVGSNLNKDKLIKMALIHDIGEIITGDVVVQRGEVIDLTLRDSKEEQGKQLDEFFLDANTHMKEPLLKEVLEKIMKSRKKEYRGSLAKKLGGKI